MKITPGKGRLQHITGIHGTIGFTGTYHGMELIHKQDNLPLLLGNFFQHAFQALFKFSPIFCAGNQSAHIQRQQPFSFQPFRHFPINDALCQSLNDSGFTHPWLTNQHRVIFRSSLQNLYGTTNFIVSPNNRIQFSLLSPFSHIKRIL
ncbi:hypothetical protein CI610_00661 [invertebrate metagenome]|uniref:Uncharacterized protein n=1 Tax=invertebrate metagenome TaxID=1711999 RepID=A0A2H9TB75_9ZZZZ